MPREVTSNPDFLAGTGAALIVDGRDETRLNNKVTVKDQRAIEDRTTFQSAQNAREKSYGIWSGLINFSGFLSEIAAVVSAQLATRIGKSRLPHYLLLGPSGLLPGYEALFTRTLASDFDVEVNSSGITTAAAGFATSAAGIESGICLHACHVPGTGEPENAKFSIVGSVPNTVRLGVQATAGEVIADVTTPTDLASWKTAIESLPEYTSCTVTGSVTNTGGNWVINLVFEFDGTDAGKVLPPPLATNSEVERYVANGNGTFNGAAIVPGDTLTAIRDAIRATAGCAGVNVDGTSVQAWAGGDALTGATRTDAGNFVDPGWTEYDRGAGSIPVTISKYTSTTTAGGTWANHALYTRANAGDAWTLLHAGVEGDNVGSWTLQRYVKIEHTNWSSPFANGAQSNVTLTTTDSDPVAGSVDVNIRFLASAGNATQKVATGAGVASTLTNGGSILDLAYVTLDAGGIQGFSYNYLTAAGNGAWIDGGGDLAGFTAALAVLYASDATLTVYVDHADDNAGAPGVSSVATSFAAATQPGAQFKQLPSTPLKRWRRVRWTLAGTNPVAVFTAAVSA